MSLRSHVRGGQGHLARDLTLYTEAPIDEFRRAPAEVRIVIVHTGRRRPGITRGFRVAGSKSRTRCHAGRACEGGNRSAPPRQKPGHGGHQRTTRREGRRSGKAKGTKTGVKPADRVAVRVHHAVAGANHSFRVELVGQAEPWPKVLEVIVGRGRAVARPGAGTCKLQSSIEARYRIRQRRVEEAPSVVYLS